MSLGYESLEGTLVEDVDEMLLEDHLVELNGQCLTVVGSELLDAYALAQCIFGAAGLADLGDAHAVVDHDLHLLLAQLMAVDGQCRPLLTGYTEHCLRVAEDVAVHEQELSAPHLLHRHPQRIDIIVVSVVSIVEEVEGGW